MHKLNIITIIYYLEIMVLSTSFTIAVAGHFGPFLYSTHVQLDLVVDLYSRRNCVRQSIQAFLCSKHQNSQRSYLKSRPWLNIDWTI